MKIYLSYFLLFLPLCFGNEELSDSSSEVGDFLDSRISSGQECLSTCLALSSCKWFSYDLDSSLCLIVKNADSSPFVEPITTTSTTVQQKVLSYNKIFVAVGRTESEKNNEVEIIDLGNQNSKCSPVSKFPFSRMGAIGGLVLQQFPILCGGHGFGWKDEKETYQKDCYYLKNNIWKKSISMFEKRVFATMVSFPMELGEKSGLLVIGGFGPDGKDGVWDFQMDKLESKFSELLAPNATSWMVLDLSMARMLHCTVWLNSDILMVIGGVENGILYSAETLLINIKTNQGWYDGTHLNAARRGHMCGRIRKDNQSEESMVIVVGGESGISDTFLTSVELYNEVTETWHYGPELPFGIGHGVLVEDSMGGVILVGGSSKANQSLTSLYSLAHSGAQWELMTQKLKHGRTLHTAFLIPDNIANCNEN